MSPLLHPHVLLSEKQGAADVQPGGTLFVWALLIQHLSEEREETGLCENSSASNLYVRCSMEKVLGREFTVYREAPVPRDRDKTRACFYPASTLKVREAVHVLQSGGIHY